MQQMLHSTYCITSHIMHYESGMFRISVFAYYGNPKKFSKIVYMGIFWFYFTHFKIIC